METAKDILLRHVVSLPSGAIFFSDDLEGLGISSSSIRFSLAELAQEGTHVVRLARGVYCRPMREERSFRTLLPSPDTVAHAVADRMCVRIVPCGAHAAYLSGLEPFSSAPLTFATDGSEQVVNLQNGHRLVFVKRRSHKVYFFRSERLRNLSEGLRWLGRERVGPGEKGVAADILLGVSDEDFLHDVRLCPGWIRELLRELRGVPQ